MLITGSAICRNLPAHASRSRRHSWLPACSGACAALRPRGSSRAVRVELGALLSLAITALRPRPHRDTSSRLAVQRRGVTWDSLGARPRRGRADDDPADDCSSRPHIDQACEGGAGAGDALTAPSIIDGAEPPTNSRSRRRLAQPSPLREAAPRSRTIAEAAVLDGGSPKTCAMESDGAPRPAGIERGPWTGRPSSPARRRRRLAAAKRCSSSRPPPRRADAWARLTTRRRVSSRSRLRDDGVLPSKQAGRRSDQSTSSLLILWKAWGESKTT